MLRPQIDLDATDQQRVEEYAEEHGLRMSRAYADLLTYALDERVGPTDEELRAAYRDNADRGREINAEWEHVSAEANQYLDDPANRDGESTHKDDHDHDYAGSGDEPDGEAE
jgi:hypothetical protein